MLYYIVFFTYIVFKFIHLYMTYNNTIYNYIQFTSLFVCYLMHKYCTQFSKCIWRKRLFVEIYFSRNGSRTFLFLAEKGYARIYCRRITCEVWDTNSYLDVGDKCTIPISSHLLFLSRRFKKFQIWRVLFKIILLKKKKKRSIKNLSTYPMWCLLLKSKIIRKYTFFCLNVVETR